MLVGRIAWGACSGRGSRRREWRRFDVLCEGLEGVLGLPKADALGRINDLEAETDRISEGIRDDIEPREREDLR